jgi:hypothetical protein
LGNSGDVAYAAKKEAGVATRDRRPAPISDIARRRAGDWFDTAALLLPPRGGDRAPRQPLLAYGD